MPLRTDNLHRRLGLGVLAAAAALAAPLARAEPRTAAQADADAATLREMAQQAALLEQTGRTRQALVLLRELAERTEAVRRDERERVAVALRERFASERQGQQLERLRLRAEARAAEQGTQAAARGLMVAGSCAGLLGFGVLAQWLMQSRRRMKALATDREQLQERTARDPLTQLFNRRHGQQVLDGLQAAPAPDNTVLMLLDVDHFKRVNDTHGHGVGDAVLQELARRLVALVREGDLVARWGGEEFLLVLQPGAAGVRALAFAERLLRCVGGTPFDAGAAQPLAVTVSAGVASWPAWPGEPWAAALERADAALYRAKHQGRNRATHAQVQAPSAGEPTWTDVLGPQPGQGEGPP